MNDNPILGGPTFSLRDRLFRALWRIAWFTLAAWTPAPLHSWRLQLLRIFGANVHPTAKVYGSARIWDPSNLTMSAYSSLGPGVECYCVGPIVLEINVVVSQRAHLCTGTHDINGPNFSLMARPIKIKKDAWICAEAFLGPGVTIGEGAVLAARAVTFRDLAPWTVYVGNPAKPAKTRAQFSREYRDQ
ncbi:putative colanic acid biosynthesis acetyltransferase [Mesorhizobium sp. M1169]|uniref:putative colanic acid biosynthesis acetyltransferase n=1 Tax=Mesorhizobium sp. M1169 TaxID=2957066 RepID=UPI003335FC6D